MTVRFTHLHSKCEMPGGPVRCNLNCRVDPVTEKTAVSLLYWKWRPLLSVIKRLPAGVDTVTEYILSYKHCPCVGSEIQIWLLTISRTVTVCSTTSSDTESDALWQQTPQEDYFISLSHDTCDKWHTPTFMFFFNYRDSLYNLIHYEQLCFFNWVSTDVGAHNIRRYIYFSQSGSLNI